METATQLETLVKNAALELDIMEVRDLKEKAVRIQDFVEACKHRQRELELLGMIKQNLSALRDHVYNL